MLKIPSMLLKLESRVGSFFSWFPTLTWGREGTGSKNMKNRGIPEVLLKVVGKTPDMQQPL